MEKAHYSTYYHCDTCAGVIDPITCVKTGCAICRETLLHVPHPCLHCNGEASYLQFSAEDHVKFLRAMHKDPADLSFLVELGMDMNDPKTLERGLNAVGLGSCYWKLSVALDRQLIAVRPRSSYSSVIKHRITLSTTTAVELITTIQSEMENIQMEITCLTNQRDDQTNQMNALIQRMEMHKNKRDDQTNQIDALMQRMEKYTTILRTAESSHAVIMDLAKEQC
jgi:FtsZ-binding cell division protein ZapB